VKKLKTAASPAPAVAPRPQGSLARAEARLAEAAHRLTQRRVRDLLPGRIQTRRLVLRAPMRGDVPDLVRLADNAAIADRLVRLPHPYTAADAVGFIEILAQRPDERPYVITLDGQFTGVVGLTYFEDRPPELGYWLGEPYWGKGLMTEAARGVIDAAHRTGQYQLIGARALADNASSLRVLEKLGFQRVGEAARTEGPHAGKPIILLQLERPRWM
jgi:RimJ/RimL family protein N-acetyltransferase